MGLRIWLPLVNSLENKGTSNFNITSIEATPSYVDGKIGKCYQRVTSNSQSTNGLKIDNNLLNLLGSHASVAVWVKPLGTHTHYNGTILSSGDWNKKRWAFGVSQDNSKVDMLCGGYNNYITCTVPVNEWTHLTSVYDNGTCTLYKNGAYVGYITGQAAFDSDADWTGIGRESYAGGYFGFYGCINDLRVYDHCLSAAEVREISQGLVLHYKLDGFFGGAGENLVINGDARNGLTGWSNWGTASSRQVITINNKKWFTFKTDASGNYGGFSQDRGIALYKPNTQYTISALMYASANASGRLWVHTRSTEGGANLAQYLTTVNVTTSPALYTFTFNTGTNASYTINKLNLMIGAVNTTSALDFYISNIKVEEGTKATTWVPCKEESDYDNTKIEDSSGYNHNGSIIGDLISIQETGRYDLATKWNCSSPTDNSDTGLCYIQTPFTLTTPLEMTITWWAKPESGYGGGTGHASFCTSNSTTRPTDYNTTAFHHRDNGFDIYPSDGSGVKRLSFTYTANAWHHYAITYDGSTAKAYQDGQLKTNVTIGTNKTLATFSQIYIGFSQAGGARRKTLGSYSDFRIYCTALDADAIRQLYEVGAKVDNKQNFHTFEYIEKSSNLFRSELIMPWAKPNRTRIGEIVEHNGTYALNIAPEPFYKNISDSISGALDGMFAANTSYVFDMWVDVDSVISGGVNRAGGMLIRYSDDSTENAFVFTGGNLGYQHKIYITPSTKTIQRLEFYYYTSTDVFYRIDSCIYPINQVKFLKNGTIESSGILEDTKARIIKNGLIETNEFIEL